LSNYRFCLFLFWVLVYTPKNPRLDMDMNLNLVHLIGYGLDFKFNPFPPLDY